MTRKRKEHARDKDRLDAIAARKALADPERISLEDARKELGLASDVMDEMDDLPDSAFFALAQEMGLEPEDFAD